MVLNLNNNRYFRGKSMLQNVKITSDAIIFSLFGFILPTVSSVFAVFAKNSAVFVECQEMKWKKGWGNRHPQIESGSYADAGTGSGAWSGSRSTIIRGIK
jgi:hypothetical protein